MTVTIDIKDSVADKILYFLESFKNDVKILNANDTAVNIEEISKDDLDYNYIVDARQKRLEGENTYSLDEMMKEFE